MRLKSKTVTYELTVPELKELMAEKLGVEEDQITIRFKTRQSGDDRFGTQYTETYGMEVVVEGDTPETPDSNAEMHRRFDH